jgi:hypothetical protein
MQVPELLAAVYSGYVNVYFEHSSPGSFFGFFSPGEEAAYCEYACEEFEAFGYQRFSAGLPVATPNAIVLR